MTDRRVVIVGGGLAGMAAAEALSRIAPGLCITLLESKRVLGGRAGSYVESLSGHAVDYCQHVAMGCCTNLIDMLQRCGLEQHLRRYNELTFIHPDHPPSRFSPSRLLPAPLHLIGAIDAQLYLSRRQKREIKSGLWRLMRTPTKSLDTTVAADWLTAAGQNRDTISDFWDVILVSALGEQTGQVSMAAARKVIIDGFAVARGASDVLIPTLPLAELFGHRLTQVLVGRGVDIQTEQNVQQITPRSTVLTTNVEIESDVIISTVPWHQISRLFDQWPESRRQPLPNLDAFAKIPNSSITGLHLWFDRPITDLDHAVMVGTASQWLFRDPYSARSSEQAGGENGSSPQQHYYQVVISGSADLNANSKQQFGDKVLVDTVLQELRHAFPAARGASLLHHRVVTDPNSVFSIHPDVDAIRPATNTSLPWLFLAGDWTQTGWPATMEGAVISGRKAAKSALELLTPSANQQSAPIQATVCLGLSPSFLARWLIR